MGHDRVLVGVDAGGTATRAVVTTPDGQCIGYAVAGRGNPISAGTERAAAAVRDAVSSALAASGREWGDASVIVAAMAGQQTTGAGADSLRGMLRGAGFGGRLSFESDLLATYASGTAEPFGYAVVAGTGACAIRVAGGRIDQAVDGAGWLLGDRGSGFWIGRRVAEAVMRDLDGVGPATALTPALCAHLGITPADTRREGRSDAVEQLVPVLYALPPIEMASLAPLAFRTDDRVASRILRRAGAHLGDSLAAVLVGPGPLILGGGILSRPGPVRDAFFRRLGDAAAGLDVRSVDDGAVGAGLLALRAADLPTPKGVLDRLTSSIARFR
jgi:glucosamine kinase